MSAAPAAVSGAVAFEPVKAGWLKFAPRTAAGAGAGSATAVAVGSTEAGAEEAGADDGDTDGGGTDDAGADEGGTDNDGTDDGGGVIGYCVCAPAWLIPANTERPAARRKANRNRDLFTRAFSHSVVDCATVNQRSFPRARNPWIRPCISGWVSGISVSGIEGQAIGSVVEKIPTTPDERPLNVDSSHYCQCTVDEENRLERALENHESRSHWT